MASQADSLQSTVYWMSPPISVACAVNLTVSFRYAFTGNVSAATEHFSMRYRVSPGPPAGTVTGKLLPGFEQRGRPAGVPQSAFTTAQFDLAIAPEEAGALTLVLQLEVRIMTSGAK